MKESRL